MLADLIEAALGPVNRRLEHEVVIDRRHAPDNGLEAAALDGVGGDSSKPSLTGLPLPG